MPTWPPVPPQDLSAAYAICNYNVGPREHKLVVHLEPVDFSAAVTTNAHGSPDFNYDSTGVFLGIERIGNEASVNETLVNLFALLAPLYPTDTGFTLESIWDNSAGANEVAGNLTTPGALVAATTPPVQRFPTPSPTPTAGSDGTLTPDDSAGYNVIASIYTFRSHHGGRFRLQLVGAGERAVQPRTKVTASSGGIDTAADRALVAYLGGTNTRIHAHDGGHVAAEARLHVTEMARLRRSARIF